MTSKTSPRKSRLVGGMSAVLLTATLVVASGPFASSATAAPRSKVAASVLSQISAKGQATFWVMLKQNANLSSAASIRDWNLRGTFVYKSLRGVADRSQAGLRALLSRQNVSYSSFWIVNALQVTAGRAVLNQIAARPEVASIKPDWKARIDYSREAQNQRIQTVEWGIAKIKANQVWSNFNDRGEGIVVANIDTGVQFNHPALVKQYRGNKGGGTFVHNYNWFDPSHICPLPQPCDNNSHGTHTMGTMVGDDGDPGTNQIGVAPHAKWIAAKGCESNSCSLDALLASGQWMLAPTKLNGKRPKVSKRPHVVNNSWGGAGSDSFYRSTVQAWVAAGLFPVFANGGSGPSCGTVGAPASYPESYGVGAFDINNNIASFSSRGPSAFGGIIKPNVSAPGVAVRSSVPPNSYSSFSGTSMASPHVAGAVALIWSSNGAPALRGDIAGTRAILDSTAIDTSNLTCGGTSGNNNVWGEGRLDAFAAVTKAKGLSG
jgi:hypothetical protein